MKAKVRASQRRSLSDLREGYRPLSATLARVNGNAPLADLVYTEICLALKQGEFTPGQSLKLRALAAALGTSQTPVREAFSRLVAQNALLFHPVNRSVIVPVLTVEDVREIYLIRVSLESMAAELAAEHIKRSDIKVLEGLQSDLEKLAHGNAYHAFLRKNQKFLFAIYSLANSRRLLNVIEGLWLQIGPTHAMMLSKFDDIAVVTGPESYRELLEALERHDGKAARALVARRLRSIMDLVLESMK